MDRLGIQLLGNVERDAYIYDKPPGQRHTKEHPDIPAFVKWIEDGMVGERPVGIVPDPNATAAPSGAMSSGDWGTTTSGAWSPPGGGLANDAQQKDYGMWCSRHGCFVPKTFYTDAKFKERWNSVKGGVVCRECTERGVGID